MPSTTAAAQVYRCWYSSPNRPGFHHLAHRKRKPTSLSVPCADSKIFCALTHSQTQNCGKGQKSHNRIVYNPNSNLKHRSPFILQFLPWIDTKGTNNKNPETNHQNQHHEDDNSKTKILFSSMWWADMKAALGQRINLEAIICTTTVVFKDPKLALPHISVPDIRYIDWPELRRRGFKGVVFDKDNTLTAPYSLTPWPPLESSLESCKSEFGADIAVFSNSAGLQEYDHDGSKARTLEGAIGIKVIRHRLKKPAGTAEEIEKHFGCESSQLVMVGDRPFTDIVYGNRNGFLTVLTEPLSLLDEPFIVQQVRKLESSFVNYWCRRGMKPPGHKLLPDPKVCVNGPLPR